MKNIGIIIFLGLLAFSCLNHHKDEVLIVDSLPIKKAEYQKRIVGQLSGEFTLSNNTFIKSRWSKQERTLAKIYLKELIQSLNISSKEHNYTSPNLNPAIDLILEPFKGTNLYGILPATNNNKEYVILGAHYDTGKRGAPGAIDNATGIALIYSVVKELAKRKIRNKNIILVFFDQEEEELIGSKAFAKHLKKMKLDIHSIHCFDMVGWDSDKDNAMEIYSGSKSLIGIYKSVANRNNIPLKDIIINPVGYNRNATDFDAFVPAGFNVIGAGECYYHKDSTPFKDTPKDTFDTVNFQYLLSCSNFIEEVIKEIVSLP
ncbi:M28 family metallopeptidase [Chondrinema litorale]|uniref:M28 family metallopeptidase n=1 Tax=Chondrinema litorale TaxID=2994555 RepID=UPI002542C95C|nr:M20/M25/M40 family metallo-hydrolase [Chondrinema litorale]UZR96339.1 M20/M25/M40 family metallo-hydrolase [Chondrinema litorale]